MTIRLARLWHFLVLAGASIPLLAAATCAQLPATPAVAVPAIPPGEARVWFYRDNDPYDSVGRPYVRMNGAVVGISELGGAFYRDVLPGHYHFTVDSLAQDFNQSRDADLLAGQTVYAKVVALNNWDTSGGRRSGVAHDTFYLWLIPPQVAQAEVARTLYYGGG